MGTNTSQVAAARRKDLLKGMALWKTDGAHRVGERLASGNVVNDKQGFIKIAHFTRPIGPSPVDEREDLPEGQYNQVRTAEYTNQAYGLLLSFSKEVWRDNQYADVLIQTRGTDLRDLCNDVRDTALVNEFFNLATTNLGPDGKAYFATDHPLDAEAAELTEGNVTTASNIISGNPGVGVEALNAGVDMLRRQYDNKGRISGCYGPFVIECDSLREVFWRQIANPVNGHEPFTTDHNNGSMYSRMIGDIIPLAKSTHRDWFIIRSSSKRENHRFIWDRQGIELSDTEIVIRNRTLECSVDFRLSKGVFDWRNAVGAFGGS